VWGQSQVLIITACPPPVPFFRRVRARVCAHSPGRTPPCAALRGGCRSAWLVTRTILGLHAGGHRRAQAARISPARFCSAVERPRAPSFPARAFKEASRAPGRRPAPCCVDQTTPPQPGIPLHRMTQVPTSALSAGVVRRCRLAMTLRRSWGQGSGSFFKRPRGGAETPNKSVRQGRCAGGHRQPQR
jgi:hypothetical protein